MKHPLRTYRERVGITLSEMAAQLGCSIPTLSRIERGRRVPSFDLMGRIVGATGGAVTPNDFFAKWPERGQ